ARATAALDLRGSALDRQRNTGAARQSGRQSGVRASAAAGELPSRLSARLGQQDMLQPAAAGCAAGRERGGIAGCAPGRGRRTPLAQATAGQTWGTRFS